MFVVFGLIFAIFYFLVIRPQSKERKKREQTLKGLEKFDRVVTTAGLHGTVVSVSESEVVLKLEPDDVRLRFDRTAVWQVSKKANEPAAAEPAGKSSDAKAAKS
jgi:preprotein translocase subunit YajC